MHYTLPKSLDGYSQESGRAGRDGQVAESILMFSYADRGRLRSLIMREKEEWKGCWTNDKERNLQQHLDLLNAVTRYCFNECECRRVLLLAYFGEHFNPELCKRTCDNCLACNGVFKYKDFSFHAKGVLSLLQDLAGLRSNPPITLTILSKLYSGSKDKTLSKYTIPAGKSYPLVDPREPRAKPSKDELERLMQTMVLDGYLEERGVKNTQGFNNDYVNTGPRAHLVDDPEANFKIAVPSTERKAAAGTGTKAPRERTSGAGRAAKDDAEAPRPKAARTGAGGGGASRAPQREYIDDSDDDGEGVLPTPDVIFVHSDDDDDFSGRGGGGGGGGGGKKAAAAAVGKASKKRRSGDGDEGNGAGVGAKAGGAKAAPVKRSKVSALPKDGSGSVTEAALALEQASQDKQTKLLLSPRQRSELFSWLDAYRRFNYVQYWAVVADNVVNSLSQNPPVTMEELLQSDGVSRAAMSARLDSIQKHTAGEHLLACIYNFLDSKDLLWTYEQHGRPASVPTIQDHPSWKGPFNISSSNDPVDPSNYS